MPKWIKLPQKAKRGDCTWRVNRCTLKTEKKKKKKKNEQAAPTWAGTQPGAPYRAYQEKKKVGIWEVWHNTARPKEEDAGRNKVGLDSKAKQACVSGGK